MAEFQCQSRKDPKHMKMGLKTSSLHLIFLIFIISCKKLEPSSNSTSAAGCISEGTIPVDSLEVPLTQAQLDAINTLFGQNNLSTANQLFFDIDSANVIPFDSTAYVDEVEILSYRWYNNLPVFRWNDNYLFYNGILQPSLIYDGLTPGPDITFRLSLSSLHTIWLNNFMKAPTYWPLGNKITYPNASYRDSCLTADHGYLDAAYFDPSIAFGTRFVKAWEVAPTGSYSPMVCIEDSTGTAWPVPVLIP
jgi:hypothetical protein